MDPFAVGLAYGGAALALMGGLIGSSLALGRAGMTGSASLAEDPKQFRNVFLLASLPMTQTFYGLIVLVQFISYINANAASIDLSKGMALLILGIVVGVAEFLSALYQGQVCASGIIELPRTRGGITFSAMVLAVYVELVGILGMVSGLIGLSLIGS
ncbi:MAG: ATPase [Thermoprotei archaeon]|nr:MAG: ATPase [Thermoprotei archaeon]